jgi:hypothetical protein
MPVLFAIYYALAFYTYNAEVVVFSQLTWILIAVVILGAGCTGLFFAIFRDWSKASLVATCWLIIILSYGKVYSVVHKSLGAYFGRNVILLPIALILMIHSIIWIGKLVRNPAKTDPLFWRDGCDIVRHDLLFLGTIFYFNQSKYCDCQDK